VTEPDSTKPSHDVRLASAEFVAAEPPADGGLRQRLRASLLIGLCCFMIYNANLRSINAGDTYPARYLPFALLQYHTPFFNPIETVATQGRGEKAFWILHMPDGHLISVYPVVVPIVVAPLYIPAVAYLHARGWDDQRLDHVARVMEKLAASFLAALASALLFLLLRRRATAGTAWLLTLAYAFGTTHWVVSSQALWQHGLAELLVIVSLLCLTAPATNRRAIVAGLMLGLIASNRPPDVVIAAALGIFGLVWARERFRAVLLTVSALLPMVIVLIYNLITAGNVAGGYGVIGSAAFFEHDLLTGVAGLLVSPARGLLVFSPFFIFLVFAWRSMPRERDERFLTFAMCAAIVIQILLYAKADWRSGLSWGPRYMTDVLPILMWMLVPVASALRGVRRAGFALAVCVAIAFEAIGAFAYSGSLDLPVYAGDDGFKEQDMRPAFHWRNNAVLVCLERGLAPRELLTKIWGSFDGIQSGGVAVTSVQAGEEITATGWTLAGHASPAQVAVMIDAGAGGAARSFTERPDVRASLGEASPSGWSVTMNTAGLAPGVHRLTAVGWTSVKGDERLIAQRMFTVMPAAAASAPSPQEPIALRPRSTVDADLNAAFSSAAARIREHQQAQGSWLTQFTSEPRFHEPHAEMNTFTTALLVDLLDPLGAGSGVDESLARARRHLTSQIESTGLVRYHGLPDGPGIGKLGCAITPDTDDTALAWRVAPATDRARLTTALATIETYRTREGLYRSWLAARKDYQCLDPGSDPNPADIVIQMHLMMLLSEVEPPAARALCEALRPIADQDRVWVYYRKTPLVPILRRTDLQRAGCALKLPESRLRSDVPGQQIWVSVSRMVADGSSDAILMRSVLRELARDDFALVRTNPPLIYHNDLTATVSRYYWSEDAGYALWLRLFDEYEHGLRK
jgi:hypothetical protein